MATQIVDSGVSLKIVTNSKPRFVLKSNILTVEVLINTIIKIDIGKGALHNIYVDQAVVDSPVNSDVNDLRDQIHTMLQSVGGGGGSATAANQVTQTGELTAVKNNQVTQTTELTAVKNNQVTQTTELTAVKNAIITTQNNQATQTTELQAVKSALNDLKSTLSVVDNKMFYDPTIVDETNGNVVYKGFADPGTAEEALTWAILRETNVAGILYYHWASGNRNKDKRWTERATYTYS